VPPEDVELVKSAFETWNRGEIDAFVNYTSEDVAWLEVSGRPEGGATDRHGRERLREGLKSLFDAWESYRIDAERIEEAGDRIVAIVREVGKGRASGVEVDGRWGYLITVKNSEMVRIEAYRDAGQALRVAGLAR
jgi:ketosteroid isomerase-like protein